MNLLSLFPRRKSDDISVWLQLASVPGVGIVKFANTAKFVDFNIDRIKDLTHQDLFQLGWSENQINNFISPKKQMMNAYLQWRQRNRDSFVLPLDHPDYPPQLLQTSSPPLVLFGLGNVSALTSNQIAIVGSRSATDYGRNIAFGMAKKLAQSGWSITSGLAIGIDGLAHKGALSAQGNTIAVLACGLDQIYPKRHSALVEQIRANNGCILSESPPGTPPLAQLFPKRNRIISGLSKGTLVVEAAVKSGSLITAYSAIKENREVFAVPGNILNPQSAGCHQLIKQGAKLVEQVSDINEEFAEFASESDQNLQKNHKKSTTQGLATATLLDSVDYDTTAVEVVAQRSGLPISVVLSQLLEYELRGLVASVQGGYIKLGEEKDV